MTLTFDKMNIFKILCFLLVFFQFSFAQKTVSKSIASLFTNSEKIQGKPEYLASPYAAAGDRLYMVGHQDGTFPDLGWHVQGEMGGVWCHPIKLLDGFEVEMLVNNQKYVLNKADTFENYAFGNKLTYSSLSSDFLVERYQFVPDGKKAVYIEFFIKNMTNTALNVSIEFKAISNLMPVWLGERTNMVDGKDEAVFKENKWLVKDKLNPWFVVYGSSSKGIAISNKENHSRKPNTSITRTQYNLTVSPLANAIFPFTIAGSEKSQMEALRTYAELSPNATPYLQKKQNRLLNIIEKSKITFSDKDLEKGFRWIKYNNDWLIRDVEGQGRGLCAGLPDYPWWFGVDNEYTLKGLIATGRKDLVYSTIDLIHGISEKTNGNGKIVHEVSTNGAVFNNGNVNETPQFASLIWEVFCWTGDKAFLNKYFPTIEKGLEWLLKENDKDGNLLPDGFGMMEIHGMDSEMIDVAVYSQKAFADAAKMAKVLGKTSLANQYQSKADKIKEKINKDFWVEESNSYADFIGTKKQALHLLDDAIIRADTLKKPWAVAELQSSKKQIETYRDNEKRGFVMHHNWVVNTPMEMGIADREKAIKALETAKKFTNPYGMFVTGIDRDETAGSEEGSFVTNRKIFTYTGAVMTLPTGVQAVAENNYGRPDEAYSLLKRMMKSFSFALPGSIYEVSPDFGMFSQAWNMYAFGEPIIKQFFGIKPLAHLKTIHISPLLPSKLTEGKIESVEIGENLIGMSFTQKTDSQIFDISQKNTDWKLVFSQPKGKFGNWRLNGKLVKPMVIAETEVIEFKGLRNSLVLEN
ncbi:glycogen debranching protein [Lacihabitans soyangensis]|uniref:Glycogen debranching protein n=2 Tax=Lacihabitans soyangensis TaxID=869394 RepID=A0AAE3H2A9_9BACT|nr:glycogen debranching protein [Lacihabitans soyangensis]